MNVNLDSNASNDDRLREVARILAAGILRLHARAALLTQDSDEIILPNSAENSLEVSGQTVLSVLHTG